MSKRRVVVTGMGMVSPLGNSVAESWDKAVNGQSGIDHLESFDVSAFNTRFGGAVKNLDVTDYLAAKDARKMDIFIQYGLVAGIQAWLDSGLQKPDGDAHRYGAFIGSGIGGIGSIEANNEIIHKSGPRRISPFFVPGSIINMISGHLSIMYGLKGPNIAVTTACTTGTHAIGLAARHIQYGDADVMLAGGSEMATTPVGLGGFSAARALSTRNDDPQSASRPWDKDRDGFVLSDGAAVLVLEEYEHAKQRGAKIYAELTGFGMSGDAYHMTSPPEDGAGARLAMENALRDASLNPDAVNYINAHGTSTPLGDRAESCAVETLFGNDKKLAVSSTKSMTGHALGAAGALEAVFSVMSIVDQVAPPTINLDNPDDGCNLNYVPHTAQTMNIDVALSNSFGFGGTNGSLLFKKV